MRLDPLGVPIYSKQDVLDIVYQGNGHLIKEMLVDIDSTELAKFNQLSDSINAPQLQSYTPLDLPQPEFDALLQQSWNMPDDYKNMDIEGFLVNVCPKENYQRLIDELTEFKSRNMLDLLRWLKYFVDTCRANNVVWGVGRGSSVASYVLFLLGVHRINSVQYKLDWKEFLR